MVALAGLAFQAFLVASAIGYSPWGATRLAAAAARTCPSSRARVVRLNAADESSFEGAIASFAPRQDLPSVRGQLAKLQEQLNNAVEDEEYVLAAMLRDDLQELKSKDPAAMAVAVRAEMNEHVACERYDEAALCRDQLMVLRRFLPQYQLAGLWKGNYPNHGEEMVRVHYAGDTLYATKVTGDEHVPAGEVTFRADLAAPLDAAARSGADADVRVEVLSISSAGGHEPREVEQIRGEGRIAARGFRHPHYVPGQLFLMDDDVIGFLWLPIGTFVVFSRVAEDEEMSTEHSAAAAAALGLSSGEEFDISDFAPEKGGDL